MKVFFKFQIKPAEIENVIESIEGVNLVCVIGIPDEKATNLAAAVILKRPGFERLSEHEIASVVAEKLPFYKQLYGGVYFVDEMPMLPNGRIFRRGVKETAISKYKIRYKAHV